MGDPKAPPILSISDTPVDIRARQLSAFGPNMGNAPCRCDPPCPPRPGKKRRYHNFPSGEPITAEEAARIPLRDDDIARTQEVRRHPPGSNEQNRAKKKLRALTPGVVVAPFRTNANVRGFTGIIPLDCDGTKDPGIWDRLINDPCVAHVKVSPGGHGFHVWAVVDPLPTADTYEDQQQQVLGHFRYVYGDAFEKIEDLKDLARFQFAGSSPDAHFNPRPRPLIAVPKRVETPAGESGGQGGPRNGVPGAGVANEETAPPAGKAWRTRTRQKLQAALQDIPLPQGSYPEWVAVCYGLVGADLESRAEHGVEFNGRDLFVDWTRANAYPESSKPNRADAFYSECEATYDLTRPRRGSIESILETARRHRATGTGNGRATPHSEKTRPEAAGDSAGPEGGTDRPPYHVSEKSAWGFREALAHLGFEVRYNTRSLKFEIRPTTTSAFKWGDLAPPQPNGWITINDPVSATLRAMIARDCRYEDSSRRILRVRIGKETWQDWLWVLGSETYGDPWKEFLFALPQWDREDRFARLFPEAYGVAPGEAYSAAYLEHAARLLFLPIIGRTLDPGAEASTITVVIGPEETGKSYGLELRFPPQWARTWYQKRVSFRWSHQDTVEGMSGCVSGEIAEMAGLNRVESEHVKNFVENQIEKNVRLSYRHDPDDFPRPWHLVGTSNRITDGLLPDVDGLRRFWPVDVGYSDYRQVKKWLDENRDQIWAQALAECQAAPGSIEPWRNPRDLREEVKAEVDRHRQRPQGIQSLADMIDELDVGEKGETMAGMLYEIDAFGPKASDETPNGQTEASVAQRISVGYGMTVVQKLGPALEERGWTKTQKRERGKRPWTWVPPPRPGTGGMGSTGNSP